MNLCEKILIYKLKFFHFKNQLNVDMSFFFIQIPYQNRSNTGAAPGSASSVLNLKVHSATQFDLVRFSKAEMRSEIARDS